MVDSDKHILTLEVPSESYIFLMISAAAVTLAGAAVIAANTLPGPSRADNGESRVEAKAYRC